MEVLTEDQQAVYDAVMERLSGGASAVENLQTVSAVGNEDTSLPVVTSNGQLVTILIGTLVALSAQNLSQSLALWAGPASPSTDPGSSPYNKVYLACESGSYTNFLDEAGHVITLGAGEVALIRRKATYWEKETIALLNKAYALAAADNANNAAQAVTDWFGADDGHGIRKTWKDWFSNTLSGGVRKVWSDWFGADDGHGIRKTWKDWFSDTLSGGVRKVWSDWYSGVQVAWNGFFGTTADDANGVRKIWSSWYASVQGSWTSFFGSNPNGGVRGEWASLKTDAQNATNAANQKAALANEKAILANEKALLANEKANLANDAASNANTQAGRAKEYADHPPMMGDNGNWWGWDETDGEYKDTGILAKGGILYPSFRVDPATMHLMMGFQDDVAVNQFSLDRNSGHLIFNYQ